MSTNEDLFRIGIDIGSTTVKVVALDKQGKMLARAYVRHFSEVRASVARNVAALAENGILSPSDKVAVVITGSGVLAWRKCWVIPSCRKSSPAPGLLKCVRRIRMWQSNWAARMPKSPSSPTASNSA